MRFQGTLTSWNDERGFGRIESIQGGEPIFVHISAWPRGNGRPKLGQVVSFEVETGPKGKRACNLQFRQASRVPQQHQSERTATAQWGTATLFAIPAFFILYLVVTVIWKVPVWYAGVYLALSVVTFIVYANDKAAASSGGWRQSESSLHTLALVGGWPGALLAQQFLRHKSTKKEFRSVFWATVWLNVMGFIFWVSPYKSVLMK